MPLHAQEQEHGEVPRLAAGRLNTVRVFHHGHDSSQHYHSYDEGLYVCLLPIYTCKGRRNSYV